MLCVDLTKIQIILLDKEVYHTNKDHVNNLSDYVNLYKDIELKYERYTGRKRSNEETKKKELHKI